MNNSPPKWATRFLEWYCNPELLEEIQGDLYELYQKRIALGYRQANLKFTWDVIRFFRWANIKRTKKNYTSNSFTMFSSYFKLGFRNAMRNKLTSAVNLFGLSLALGVAIAAFAFIDYMKNMDTFHVNRKRVYQITSLMKVGSQDLNSDNWSDSPILLAPALKEDNSAIETYTRIKMERASMRYNEAVFNESVWFVDPDFMSMFSYPLLYGNPKALERPNEIILTKRISEKYFGNINPVGQVFSLKFINGSKEDFTVGAVLDEFPGNASIRFSNLISIRAFESLQAKSDFGWGDLADATLVMLKEGHSVSELAPSMGKYKELQNRANPDLPIHDFLFYSLELLSQRNNEIYQDVAGGGHPAGLIALGVIALLLLLLACFNYMNIAVATVSTRLKEIGIRKVVGGRKKEIVTQFLVENLVLCAGALAIGVLLAHLFFMPGLNTLFPIYVSFSTIVITDLIIFLIAILLFVGLISGSYPALYISSFQPVRILRGNEKFGQKSLFSRSLLTIQFMLAFTTIIGCFVFINNSLNLKNKDWGYDHDQNYVVPVTNYETFLAMRDHAAQNKDVISHAGTLNLIGRGYNHTTISYNSETYPAVVFQVGFNLLETMNLRLKSGRFFDEKIQSDKIESVVINTVFADAMGWDVPVGQSFEYDSVKRFVIGVVEKFHYDNFYAPVEPVFFTVAPEESLKYLAVKVQAGSLKSAEEYLKEGWRKIAPDDPFDGYYQDSVFEGFHLDNNANMKLLVFISSVTVILACMGLFGLVTYSITRRMKEFSVRKVFGANVKHIFRLMNADYIWMVSIAFIIGAPLGFILINKLINIIYPEPVPADAKPFLLGIAIMAFTILITVATQISRVAKNNPAQTLRNE